jgi:hypothetical protein
MSEDTPAVVVAYLKAAGAGDIAGLAACFAEDGEVHDEGSTYRGRAEITRWRDALLGQWTFTTTLLGTERVSESAYRATVHVEGNFPGGTADLGYDFVLADGLISDLRIG